MKAHAPPNKTSAGPRRRRKFNAGLAPGTLSVDPEAAPSVVRVFAYGPASCVEKTLETLDALPALLREHAVTWVNVDGLGNADTIAALGRIFALHPLALEDVVNVRQRPKVEAYDRYQFLVLRMVTPGTALPTDQMSMFIGDNFVLTFQEHPGDCFEWVRRRLRQEQAPARAHGADYLAYTLIDALVDHYFPVLEACGERLDALQDRVVRQPNLQFVHELSNLKRDLLHLRRAIWPLRDELSALARQPMFIRPDIVPYLRDCHDHTLVLLDMIETLREVSGNLMDIYLSSVSNRMNGVMQLLTVIATIFIPLTFIAGVYGMNFNPAASPWNMPELNAYWGYPVVLGSMLTCGLSLLLFFWRKGWLRS